MVARTRRQVPAGLFVSRSGSSRRGQLRISVVRRAFAETGGQRERRIVPVGQFVKELNERLALGGSESGVERPSA